MSESKHDVATGQSSPATVVVQVGASQTVEDMISLDQGVDKLMGVLQENAPRLPEVHIEFENLSYSVELPAHDDKTVPNVLTAVRDKVKGLLAPKSNTRLQVLNNVSGYLRPGTLTLLLAPPGHGKSSFMKALAGRLPSSKLSGKIWYGGKDPSQVNVRRLVSYVEQDDTHFPLLSVEETMQFANVAWGGPGTEGLNPVMAAAVKNKVALTLQLLGLAHCKDTIVGDDLMRGVSGGEKKRVTLGEMIMPEYRAFFLDEISTGLDSAASYDIVKITRSWVKHFQSTGFAALLQPTPEVFNLFDDVMLMREGQIIYHGPRESLVPYFEEMGLIFPTDQDQADFLTEFISDPREVYAKRLREMVEADEELPESTPPLNTDELVLYFKAYVHRDSWGIMQEGGSKDGEEGEGGEESKAATVLPAGRTFSIPHSSSFVHPGIKLDPEESEYSKRIYVGDHAGQSFWHMVKLLLARQFKLQFRNKGFVGPRIGQSIFLGLILGTLFFQLEMSEAGLRFGLLFFSALLLSFSNMSEVPIAAAGKLVVYKQTDAKFYTVGAYVMSVLIAHLPIATMEAIIFGTITYFMCGFASEVERYFTFLLLVWLLSLVMSNVFRLFAFVAKNEDVAQSMVGPSVGLSLLFGGFLITKEKIPEWLVWIYWATPFSWTIRSLAINEFTSSDYDAQIPTPAGTARIGDVFLGNFNMSTDTLWIWRGVVYLVAAYVVTALANALALSKLRFDPNIGTTRTRNTDHDMSPAMRLLRDKLPRRRKEEAQLVDLPFDPVTLVFKELRYSVPVPAPSGKGTVQKELLKGINGFAEPGQLTALMGSSGAGKTTLMDVIAGRKTGGKMSGEILVNGHPKNTQTFSRVMGYVEQFDLLTPYATVAETLHFAAKLRLGKSVSAERRNEFVAGVLSLLELDEVAHRLVGDETSSSAISAGERKRLGIGVELVASPTVLFLDEPTSGLDSRAAAAVMRVIKKVAATGRTVVCTIHQPSAELFYMFDRLLLLKKGGEVVYFGSVEQRAANLVKYLEAIPGTNPLPPRTNPADWMLTVIGAGVGNAVDTDFAAAYRESELRTVAITKLDKLVARRGAMVGTKFTGKYAASLCSQFGSVIYRQLLSAWRNTPLTLTRTFIFILLGFMFGLLFRDLDTSDRAGVNSKLSFVFVVNLFLGVIMMTTAMPVLSRERSVFYRERASSTYASPAYSTAILIAEIPFIAINVLIFHGISYFMVGLEADVFWYYLYVSCLQVAAFVCLGQLLVALLPNKSVAQIMGGMAISLFNLFAGFFVPRPDIAAGWIWAYWANPCSYAFQILTALQFHCDGADCPTIIDPSTGSFAPVKVSDLMSDYVGFNYDDRFVMTVGLELWVLGLHLVTALGLAYVNHLKR